MVTKADFITRIKKLPKQIPSKTGTAFYTNFELTGNHLSFIRVNTKKKWSLDIETLWEVYSTEKFINTSVVKRLTGGQVNSPSVAILMAINCIDNAGKRV